MAVEHILCKVSLYEYGKNPMHRHCRWRDISQLAI